jgi:small basic protein
MNTETEILIVSMLVGVVIPVLIALVTTKAMSAGLKAILLALLSALAGFVTEWLASPDDFNWQIAVLTWFQTFIIAVATHFGLWKPTGVTQRAQEIGVTSKEEH